MILKLAAEAEAPHSPHRVLQLYGYEVWNPISRHQLCIDISQVMGRKLESLRAHASQIKNVDYIEAIKGLAKYRGVTTMTGEYAEVFEILKETSI